MTTKFSAVLFFCFVITCVGFTSADVIHITLSNNPPSLSSELSNYISAASLGGIHRVGFNAADVGQGPGDGLNEMVAFSFLFDPIVSPIASATLSLDLTKPSVRDTSDLLLFADNNTPSPIFDHGPLDPYYGNPYLGTLDPSTSVVITLDLLNMPTNPGFLGVYGSENLASLLADGDLNVVYWEDATIHSARLTIDLVPEPGTLLLGMVASVVCLLLRGRRA